MCIIVNVKEGGRRLQSGRGKERERATEEGNKADETKHKKHYSPE